MYSTKQSTRNAPKTTIFFVLLKWTGSPDRFKCFDTQLVFEFFTGFSEFYIIIEVFLPVKAQLGWLDNVTGVPGVRFSLLLIG